MLIHKCRRMTLQRPITWRQRQEARKQEKKASDSKELIFSRCCGTQRCLGSAFYMFYGILRCLWRSLRHGLQKSLGFWPRVFKSAPPFQRDRVFLCFVWILQISWMWAIKQQNPQHEMSGIQVSWWNGWTLEFDHASWRNWCWCSKPIPCERVGEGGEKPTSAEARKFLNDSGHARTEKEVVEKTKDAIVCWPAVDRSSIAKPAESCSWWPDVDMFWSLSFSSNWFTHLRPPPWS